MIVKGGKITRKIAKILVIQLGDIGDVVWATPALRAIKEKYPQAKLSVLVRSGNGPLLKADPHVAKVFEVPNGGGGFPAWVARQIQFLGKLRAERFDLLFDLRADERGAYLSLLSGVPIKVSGYYHDAPFWRNRVYSHLIDSDREEVKEDIGAAKQCLSIVRPFGIDTKDFLPRLWIESGEKENALQVLRQEGTLPEFNWVTINPFSRWQYKEWNHDKWVTIIDWLSERYKLFTVIVGSPAEKGKADSIAKSCKVKVFNLAGKTNLAELAAVLGMSRLHIGVDSAAPHIAAAVGTPTVTIYGPSDWREWAPRGDGHEVIVPDLSCAPCYQKGCEGKGWSRCLDELSVETVQEAVRNAVERHH
jgi:heptosyltransferase-3